MTTPLGSATRALCAGAVLSLLATAPGTGAAMAATTWLQGQSATIDGMIAGASGTITLGSGGTPHTGVGSSGFYVLGGLQPGSRDQFCLRDVTGTNSCAETRFIQLTPALDQKLQLVTVQTLSSWRADTMMDGDGTRGEMAGTVLDAFGMPVMGATVTLEPSSGSLYYFDSDGTIEATGGSATGSNGRFLFLDTDPGLVKLTAFSGSSPIALAYARATDLKTGVVNLRPTSSIGGTAIDTAGVPVGGASVAWDFDSSISATATGSGNWVLSGIAQGLDLTVRATHSGFHEAITFRRSAAETSNPQAITVRMLSDAQYLAIPAGFGTAQAPSLGMIVGTILNADGSPAAGATVSIDPDAAVSGATIGYFSPNGSFPGSSDPSLFATSTTGSFIVMNVPVGDVVVSAIAPGAPVRSGVAPSLAGGVAFGDLIAYETQTLSGTVLDDEMRDMPVGGALVQIVEFPLISTIVGPKGQYSLPGVPKNTLISVRAAKDGFTSSVTFRHDSGPADTRSQDVFLPSESSVGRLYAERGLPFNRALGLVGTFVRLSTNEGVAGLIGEAVPVSGVVSYPGVTVNRAKPPTLTSRFGNINILAVTPVDGGVLSVDPRSRFTSFVTTALLANTVAIDSLPVDCDNSPGVLAALYPCDQDVVKPASDPMYFAWERDGEVGEKWQVQYSTDPGFSTIDLTSASSKAQFMNATHWTPGKKKWKKIKALGDGGAPIFWRVLQRTQVAKMPDMDNFSSAHSFTIE